MSRITGKNGKVMVGANTLANISDWSLDLKIPTADATAMGDDWSKKLSTIRDWSGQIKGHYGNAAEASDLLASFFAATAASGSLGGSITVVLYPDRATAECFSGVCYADFSMSVDKSKPNDFTAKITGTDELTHTPNS